jgi:hypothetical protein
MITVRCMPSFSYNAVLPTVENGSNHIRYEGSKETMSMLRFIQDYQLIYLSLISSTKFHSCSMKTNILSYPLTNPLRGLLLTPSKTFQVIIVYVANTKQFWQEWCKYVNMPFEFQKYVLRCAMILRISIFDGNSLMLDSGAILKSMTSSIPY